MENPRVRIIILLILTWLSTWYVTDKLVLPNVKDRIKFEALTLAGQNEPPYRYRLFEATINKAIQDSLLFNIKTPEIQHIASYALFLLATFGLLYSLLYRYLCHFFDPKPLTETYPTDEGD